MAKDKRNSGYKYGSVNRDEESGAKDDDKNFDESNLYYVKDDNTTKEEKNYVKLAVPIIIAALFIGGLAFMLFHNFEYFYPNQDGHVNSDVANPTKVTEIDPPSSSFPASSCQANPKCVHLELTGECCPADNGVKLDCCS